MGGQMIPAAVLLVIVSGAAVSAQQSATSPRSVGQFDLFRPAAPGPGVRLQLPQRVILQPAPPAVMPPPVVVCGMTLVPGDPSRDRKMLHDTPESSHFSIEGIEPQTCRRQR